MYCVYSKKHYKRLLSVVLGFAKEKSGKFGEYSVHSVVALRESTRYTVYSVRRKEGKAGEKVFR